MTGVQTCALPIFLFGYHALLYLNRYLTQWRFIKKKILPGVFQFAPKIIKEQRSFFLPRFQEGEKYGMIIERYLETVCSILYLRIGRPPAKGIFFRVEYPKKYPYQSHIQLGQSLKNICQNRCNLFRFLHSHRSCTNPF